MAISTDSPSVVAGQIDQKALLLLGWICAIGATGASLSAISLVDASESMALSSTMRAVCAGAISLTIAATAVPAGLLADRIGRRRLLMWSFVVTGCANLLIAVVPQAWSYLVGLVLAGLGYGAMGTSAYAYVKRIATGNSLGRALGMLGVYISVLTFLANVGGSALANVNWRLLFVVLPIMCLVALALTPRLLPVMETIRGGAVDWPGIVLLALSIMGLVGGLGRISSPGGQSQGFIALAASGLCFAAWLFVESRASSPLLPLGLLRTRLFVAAMIVGLLMNAVMGAAVLGLSDLLQYAQQDDVSIAAMLLQPFFVIGSIGGAIAGRFLSRSRPPYLVAGTTLTAQAQVFVQAATGDHYGPLTSLKTTVSQIGSGLGMVLSVVALQLLTDNGLSRQLTANGIPASELGTAQQVMQSFIESGQPPRVADATALLHASAESFSGADDLLMLGSAVACALTAVIAWFWLRQPAAAEGSDSTAR
ncbi:MAG: MFS transporter [Actinobacteria bacterium]|nr:MFS transporter [Actinomycetota bacterium]